LKFVFSIGWTEEFLLRFNCKNQQRANGNEILGIQPLFWVWDMFVFVFRELSCVYIIKKIFARGRFIRLNSSKQISPNPSRRINLINFIHFNKIEGFDNYIKKTISLI